MITSRMDLDFAGEDGMSEREEDGLSQQETALYDRQIRIWGALAQRRLNKSHVFVSGLDGTLVEFCKNDVLARVGRLTLNDDRVVTGDSFPSSYFLVPDTY